MSKPAPNNVVKLPVVHKLEAAQQKQLKKHQSLATRLFTEASSLRIRTVDEYEAANRRLVELKTEHKKVEEMQGEILDPIAAAQKLLKQSTAATKKLFAPVFETLDYAEDKFKTALIEYKQHADAEAAKLQAKQAEVARKKQEKLEAKAEALEAKGKHEQAAAARAEALTVAAPMISAMTPKLAGTSFKKKWVGKVVDARDFYQAVADGDIPVDAAPIDQGYINRQAGISQTLLNWPGVEVKEELVAATRAE